MEEKKVEEEAPNMRDLVKDLVGRLKARWTQMRDSTKIGEMLEKVGDWKDAEISIHMLGWLYSKTDDKIMEESVEMVKALEEVAYSSNITKAGESTMEEVVQLCTLLTACNREKQEDEGNHHHQEEDRDHTLKEEGAPGDKAVISACSNGMPGSLSQASPGGTCPRTLKPDTITNLCKFYQHQAEEERDQHHGEDQIEADQGHHQGVGQDEHHHQQGEESNLGAGQGHLREG